jgi:MYXO-CTERM domain-containing protein
MTADAGSATDARPSDARPTDARPTDARTADGRLGDGGAIVEPLGGGYLEGGGCDCRAGRTGASPQNGLLLLLGLAFWLRVRRRRR